MRLSILSDYRNIINLVKKEQDWRNFVYIVFPIVDQEEVEANADWEGGFNFLRKVLNRKIDMLEKSQFRNSQFLQVRQEIMQGELSLAQLQMDGIETKLDLMKKDSDNEIDMMEEIKKLLAQQAQDQAEKQQEKEKAEKKAKEEEKEEKWGP